MNTHLVNANSLAMPLADGSVHMIATSPPYWGLRDYGLATWEGGDAECDHVEAEYRTGLGLAALGQQYRGGGHKQGDIGTRQYRGQCAKCGALQVSGGLGLEPLHDCLGWATGHNCGACYVCRMRLFATECWRVLRDDGVMWLNLGDSYAASRGSGASGIGEKQATNVGANLGKLTVPSGLKPKDLVGIPWRVALALQADGWYLRSDIIWAKPNPMPESVTDRPTKSHEYVFLLAKSARYFYDAEAVKETMTPGVSPPGNKKPYDAGKPNGMTLRGNRADEHLAQTTRNRRTVWTIATQPYSGAHFATWPEALVEPMVKAGTSERGCCPVCGKAWERVVEKVGEVKQKGVAPGSVHKKTIADGGNGTTSALRTGMVAVKDTIGWQPTCACDAGDPIPCTVLDPFAGSGTTGVVARRFGRRFIGLDLSLPYLRDQARTRLELDRLADWHTGTGRKTNDTYHDLPLFND